MMAIQFPNFLSVPVRTPDYSGIADIVQNYYAGKDMPKQDLMRAIQAEFARPNAEESLKGSRLSNTGKELSNRKEQLDIDRLVREAAEQKAFEDQLRKALSGIASPGGGAMPSYMQQGATAPVAQGGAPAAAPSAPPALTPQAIAQALSQPAGLPVGQPVTDPNQFDDGLDRSKMEPRYRKFDQQATGLPASAYGSPPAGQSVAPTGAMPAAAVTSAAPETAPAAAAPQPEAPHEIVLTQGSPHLFGIDAMWDQNPLSRAFLEKKGYKKTQDIKFNQKTGQTTIITKYPSGTITQQTISNPGGSTSDGIPLTNKLISQHQQMIAAIDNAKPVIEEIINQKGFQPYPRGIGMGLVPGWMGQAATYDTLVKSALDTLMKAYGLPSTNEGIATVKDQLLINHGETTGHYRQRLRNLIKDLDRRKAYSENEVKRSNKIQRVDTTAGGQTYSSDDWEVANDQQ